MKYKVRIEIEVVSTDFEYVTVEAKSEAEARELAAQAYRDGKCNAIDRWASDSVDSNLDTRYQSDWTVEKL